MLPSDDAYDAARRVWNASVDKRPVLIARCSGGVDVMRAVEFAREHDFVVAVRGGGHSVAGFGTCAGGVVIDLSRMRGISVDLVRRTVRVEGGANWGDVDHETQAYGLATTGGMVSTTGVGGLTLGGGIGWLMRKHGLACDNLLSVDMVTAGGRTLHANADENPDLFWCVRGGGGNFGIVTSFEFGLHPVGPAVTAGAMFFGGDDAGAVMRFYRDWIVEVPNELTTLVSLTTAPAAPFLPEDVHGRPVIVVAGCFAGERRAAARAFRPLKELGSSVADLIGPTTYIAMQTFADSSWGPGAHNSSESVYLRALDDDTIANLLSAHERVTSPQSEVHLHHLGGAIARVPEDETAVAQREAPLLLNALARWDDADDSVDHARWARRLCASVAPATVGGAPVNFLGNEGAREVEAAYGEETFDRLVALKSFYDPTNLFRVNHNVPPNPRAARVIEAAQSNPRREVPAGVPGAGAYEMRGSS
ncbi:MAG: FAD-binding oxidoreductase [Gaiellaceae bacterium]